MTPLHNLFLLATLFGVCTLPAWTQTWNAQMVNPGYIGKPRLTLFDDNQNPCLFYYQSNGIEIITYFSKWNGSTWLTKSTNNIGQPVCAIKQDSLFHLITSSPRHFILSQDGATKSSGYCPGISSIALGPPGYLVGARASGALYIYKFNLSTNAWSSSELIDESGSLSGADVVVASNGTIWIAYYDGIGRNLKVARSSGSSWDVWFVDTEGDVGAFAQIKVDANNVAHITYYDATNQRLKYATFNP